MKDIRDSLAVALKEIADILELPVAYENVMIDPAGKAHLAERLSVNSRALRGLGKTVQEYSGVYNVGVHYPAGTNPDKAISTADEIVDYFSGLGIVRFPGGYVRVTTAKATAAIADDVWYIIPVSLDWTGYTKEI